VARTAHIYLFAEIHLAGSVFAIFATKRNSNNDCVAAVSEDHGISLLTIHGNPIACGMSTHADAHPRIHELHFENPYTR
jgi:uncharacterized Zn-finger protein